MHFEFCDDSRDKATPSIIAFPAGLLYGFGVYTTFVLPLAERWLAAHWARLQHDARAAGLALPTSLQAVETQEAPNALKTWLQRCAEHPDNQGKPVVRLTLLPAVEGYGDFYAGKGKASPLSSRLLCTFRKTTPAPAEGVALKSCRHSRWMPQVKWCAMADAIYFRRQAMQDGYHDVLFVNPAGHISESSTANLFLSDGRELFTPDPWRDGCLPGITRLRVLEAAAREGLSVRVASCSVSRLAEAQGAFLTNAAQGLIRVQSIDGKILPWPPEALAQWRLLQERPALP